MEIEITQEVLDEVKAFINGDVLIKCMTQNGLSFSAMGIILQAITSTVKNLSDGIS